MIVRYKTILTVLLSCFLLQAWAQSPENDVTISGVIQDVTGKPIQGVNITVQEKTVGVFSNAEGKYTITSKGNDVLVFSKPGFNTLQKAALDLSNSAVVMTASLIDGGDNDDVEIPFGVRKRREITASISSIKGSELPQLPLSSLNNILAGRLAGLHIKQSGTRPGVDDANFLIRGRSSYNANQSPLILVDGVERDFTNMDLNEIENISVFKDAGSLSWYGMTAANGVIYVTTRRGSPTSTKVTLDMQGGVQTPVNITRPLDAYTYATLYNQALANNGFAPQYDQTALDAYKSGSDPYKYPNNNFVDRFIKKAAPVQRYVATVSGGNSFAKYFTLLSFYNQSGLYNHANNNDYNSNSNFQRYNFRTNLTLHLNKNLDVRLDVGGRLEKLRYANAGNAGLLDVIYNTPANAFPLLNPDSSYGGSSLFKTSNPLALLNANGNTTDLKRTMLATLDVRQKLDKITKGLSLNVFYTYDITSAYTSGYTQGYAVYESNGAGGYNRFGTETPLKYSTADFNSNLRVNEFWAGFDYDRTFNGHTIRVTSRYQTQVSAAPNRLNDSRESFANRISYDYKERYFADVVATYAGSQFFAPGKRWGLFPALSAGWIITEENFLKKSSVLDFLKLRGSVGLVGNEGVGARDLAFNNYWNRSGDQYFFGTGFSSPASSTEQELANPNLTWEKATKASFGVDAKLFKQSLSLSVDYFYENRNDLLTTALLPNILGQSVVNVNEGKAQYRGFEAAANYNRKFGQVNVSLNGNFTLAKTKIIAINEEAGIPKYQKQVGFGIGRVIQFNSESSTDYIGRFLIAEGLFQSKDEINNAPVQRFSGQVLPGDIRYKDVNADGVIDNLDYVMTNYSDIPKIYFGFGVGLQYKHFDLSGQFQGVEGRTINIQNIINSGTSATGYINQFSVDAWTAEKAASALYPRLAISDRGNNTTQSTYWLRSGDFIKLKNLELGYTLGSTKKGKKSVLNGSRIYVTGFNLLTFSKVSSLGIDPEIPTSGYNTSYPYLRTFALGFNLKF
jgi:TonB-dependent starch-binding outer membrane protein SusC